MMFLSTRVCKSLFGISTNKHTLKSLINYRNDTIKCCAAFVAGPSQSNTDFFNICIGMDRDHLMLKKYYLDVKKEAYQLKVLRSKEFIKDAFEKRKSILLEKKNVFVKDIRETKSKVKEKMDEIVERENVLTIPNLLCVGRGILSPYIGYVIVQGDINLAMGLLLFAGLTDVMDGYIARTWPSQASMAGSFLDPMADKLLVGSLVISLSYCNLLPVWLAGMVLFRDVFLIAAGFVIRYISLPPPRTLSRYFDVTHATARLEPTFISKVNTVIQLITIATSLGAPIWHYIDHPYLHGLWYLTGTTTAVAALSYILSRNTFKIVKNIKKN